jgi:hypothetical protein
MTIQSSENSKCLILIVLGVSAILTNILMTQQNYNLCLIYFPVCFHLCLEVIVLLRVVVFLKLELLIASERHIM